MLLHTCTIPKCFVSTHSTTLPGKPSHKRRWREMLDEDGEEVGQTEVFNKTVKRKKVVESYYRHQQSHASRKPGTGNSMDCGN